MNIGEKVVISPLRYPGAKGKVIKKYKHFLEIYHKEYREPFVGGASIFLFKKKSNINWINDKDVNIATLWKVIRDYPEKLCDLINNTVPTIELWSELKTNNFDDDPIKKAFRCLFLNRTNFSGILHANPIGGLSQDSKYTIDSRWNKTTLIHRIKESSKKLQGVRITSHDFSNVIEAEGSDVFMVIDPPYYQKGCKLYPVYMSEQEHKKLAEMLRKTEHKFLLTIDDCPEVRNLYAWANFINLESWYYTINSTGGSCSLGKELFITNFELSTKQIKAGVT